MKHHHHHHHHHHRHHHHRHHHHHHGHLVCHLQVRTVDIKNVCNLHQFAKKTYEIKAMLKIMF